MKLTMLLSDLRQRGVRFSVNGERLRCSAPAGVLTPDLRGQLQARKAEILAFLRTADGVRHQQPAIVPLQALGTNPPIFAVAGHNGDVFAYRALAQYLGSNQPFYGLQPTGLDGASEAFTDVMGLATYFADQIQSFEPEGPYILAGFCAGGTVAFETARLLRARRASVPLLVMFASPWPSTFRDVDARERRRRIGVHLRALASLRSPFEIWGYLAAMRSRWKEQQAAAAAGRRDVDPAILRREQVEAATLEAVKRHEPEGRFDGRLLMVLPDRQWPLDGFRPLLWRDVAASTDEYYGTNCEIGLLLRGQDTAGIAQYLAQACVEAANSASVSASGRYDLEKCAESSASSILSPAPQQPLVTSR